MNTKTLGMILVALGLVTSAVSGCTVAARSQSPDTAAASPPTSAEIPLTVAPSLVYATASATMVPSDAGAVTPFSPDPTLTPPPDGLLFVDGGDPVVGELGTWTWGNAGSDAPWPPGNPIHVGAGERLMFKMAEPVPIESWQVARVPPSSVPGNDGQVGIAEGAGGLITFAAPPPGRWSVMVDVRFGNALGEGLYYWSVTVD